VGTEKGPERGGQAQAAAGLRAAVGELAVARPHVGPPKGKRFRSKKRRVWFFFADACAQTAEIITLLYEATQGPATTDLTAAPLNPTSSVTNRQPLGRLEYRKDPSRPGSGVYVAHGANKSDLLATDIPSHLVVAADGDDNENDAAEGPSGGAGEGSSSIVNVTPLGGFGMNVNPAMNGGGQSVKVVNALNAEMPTGMSLEQLVMQDTGFLEGLPGGMFDWGTYSSAMVRYAG
jgi:hypothetical protein